VGTARLSACSGGVRVCAQAKELQRDATATYAMTEELMELEKAATATAQARAEELEQRCAQLEAEARARGGAGGGGEEAAALRRENEELRREVPRPKNLAPEECALRPNSVHAGSISPRSAGSPRD